MSDTQDNTARVENAISSARSEGAWHSVDDKTIIRLCVELVFLRRGTWPSPVFKVSELEPDQLVEVEKLIVDGKL